VCLNGIEGSKGQELLQHDEQKGRPLTSRTEESTEVIQKCLVRDRTLRVRKLRRNDRDQYRDSM
jgi:hypothetical protein